MKTIAKMIKDLDALSGTEKLEPLEQRFVVKVSNKTNVGEISGTLPDPDQMAIRRLHSKYCTK